MMNDFLELRMTNDEVEKLSERDKFERLHKLITEAEQIIEYAIKNYIEGSGKKLAKKCILFSGGNDSTTMLHLMKDHADVALHARTGIGISQTYDFVEQTCNDFKIPLHIFEPTSHTNYQSLIKKYGFPGPAQHYIMYQKLKEDPLLKARGMFSKRGHMLMFITGRRRDESARRSNIDPINVKKNIAWVAPIVNWTKQDMLLYRKINPDIPRNQVSDLIHMSGECLCGAFAHKDEREEIRFFFPDVIDYIESLEKEVKGLNLHKEERTNWGWGAYRKHKPNKKVGDLCSSCETVENENENAIICDGEGSP